MSFSCLGIDLSIHSEQAWGRSHHEDCDDRADMARLRFLDTAETL